MINTNRAIVDKATGGRVGYVYLPDMEAAGLNEFVSSTSRRFARKASSSTFATTAAASSTSSFSSGCAGSSADGLGPQLCGPDHAKVVFYGAIACVTNAYAASDGDIFSYFFKQYKLGPLIGERTWGGVRGIRG